MEYLIKKPEMEETDLYACLSKGTKTSLKQAWRLAGTLSTGDIKQRSKQDRSTYLHHVVNQAPDVFRRYKDVSALVPIMYRLALRGVRVNAQNEHGNTCLQVACLRPHAESLCPHLLRIGVDPCIQNKKGCRVIHTYHNHIFHVVKGQSTAKSGVWNAVEKEDLAMVEKLLKTWCRVNVRKNKSLRDVSEETANLRMRRLLDEYEHTNEFVCAAFANDVHLVQEHLKLRQGLINLDTKDEALDVPKPLLVALQELGDVTKDVVKTLKQHRSDDSSIYEEQVRSMQGAFENSEIYQLIDVGSEETLLEALDLILKGQIEVKMTSQQEETKGWTCLHLVVDRYMKMKVENEERARLLIRAMYRLAFAGIEVNARDSRGETALLKATAGLDQSLMTHLIRIGSDTSMTDSVGQTVNAEVYEDKGKLVFDKNYRTADLPGLWVAVKSNDISKAERWLKSWCRVNTFKGDRRLLDVARSLKRKEIVRLLEEYQQINEFVCATFACNLKKMMDILALGKGQNKVNTIDDFFHVGYTWDRHAEFMPRPIIITALELCTPEVVDFLLRFGADLSKEHDECPPCGPIAFWAFRDHVNNENALVVAQHANVELRDELGATMLHRIIQKDRPEGKAEIVQTLLDRSCPLAARDWEGSTARDYVTIYDVPDGDELRQIIDNHVLELVSDDQHYKLETLLLDGYDHFLDLRGTKKNKTAREIAELKEHKDTIELIDEWESYRNQIELLHESAKTGDIRTISKLSGEKRCALGRDKAGRTLLHQAVLYEYTNIVQFLTEQYPHLINTRDNRKRIPLHLCVCLKDRHLIWPILQDAGADPNMVEVNNMSVYDYVRELEAATPIKEKSRGRRWQDYRPQKVIEFERLQQYGAKAEAYELQRHLLNAIKSEGLKDMKTLTKGFTGKLSEWELDIPILKFGVDHKRQEVLKYLIETCGCRAHVSFELVDSEGELQTITLREYAERNKLTELVEFIDTIPKPPEKEEENSEERNESADENGEVENCDTDQVQTET